LKEKLFSNLTVDRMSLRAIGHVVDQSNEHQFVAGQTPVMALKVERKKSLWT